MHTPIHRPEKKCKCQIMLINTFSAILCLSNHGIPTLELRIDGSLRLLVLWLFPLCLLVQSKMFTIQAHLNYYFLQIPSYTLNRDRMNSIVWRSKGAELLIKSPRLVNEQNILYRVANLNFRQARPPQESFKILCTVVMI